MSALEIEIIGCPAGGEEDSSPAGGEENSSPASGEEDSSPADGEENSSPASGEEDSSPADGEEDSSPAGGEENDIKGLCAGALAINGITDGHLAIEFVDEDRIRELNLRHRGRDEATDVLSFGIDERGSTAGPRELGDIVICRARTEDIREAVVHGALHLAGMDHETDAGEMLALQEELLRSRSGR